MILGEVLVPISPGMEKIDIDQIRTVECIPIVWVRIPLWDISMGKQSMNEQEVQLKLNQLEIIILDTEYTSWEGSLERGWSNPNEHREIVQLAAIRVASDNLKLREIEHCSVLIRPSINPVLSDYFVNLTGIDNKIVANGGLSFENAMELYGKFVGKRQVFACGNEGDIIAENLVLNKEHRFSELTEVTDLRPWFCNNGLDAEKIVSGDLHAHLGIDLKGSTHNALHDVRSILASIRNLVENGASNPFKM